MRASHRRGLVVCLLTLVLGSGPAALAEPVASQPTPTYAVEPAAADVGADGYVDGSRVRFGFTVHAGPALPSGANAQSGAFGGLSLRIGSQISNRWAIYYMGTLNIGGYALAADDELETAIFASWANTLLGSMTFWHMLELGFGPSLDSVAAVKGSLSTDEGELVGVSGTSFGVHARLALMLGSKPRERARRTGFTISLDFHPTFVDGRALLTVGIGLGMDLF